METAALWTVSVGTVIYLSAFVVYNAKMFSGKTLPNAATWGLWAFLATMSAATYRIMTGSTIASIQTFGGAAANLATFVLALKFGKFSALTKLDKVMLAIGLAAGLVWTIGKDATWANMLIQACLFISIIPTWVSVYRRPGGEAALPWLAFGISYAFQIVALAILRERFEAYVLPINAGSVQFIVGLLALRRPKTGNRIS